MNTELNRILERHLQGWRRKSHVMIEVLTTRYGKGSINMEPQFEAEDRHEVVEPVR
jgi:hypothetical protein